MILTDERLELCDRVARRFRSEWAEYDDLYQECCIWYLENYDKAEEYESSGSTGKTWVALSNRVRVYVSQEKAARAGYDPEDQFHYSIGLVQDLLPLLFDDTWREPENKVHESGSSNHSDPREGNNLVVMVADVFKGFVNLGVSDQALLQGVYGGGDPRTNVANEAAVLGISPEAMHKRIRRAIGRLRKPLGGPAIHGE